MSNTYCFTSHPDHVYFANITTSKRLGVLRGVFHAIRQNHSTVNEAMLLPCTRYSFCRKSTHSYPLAKEESTLKLHVQAGHRPYSQVEHQKLSGLGRFSALSKVSEGRGGTEGTWPLSSCHTWRVYPAFYTSCLCKTSLCVNRHQSWTELVTTAGFQGKIWSSG